MFFLVLINGRTLIKVVVDFIQMHEEDFLVVDSIIEMTIGIVEITIILETLDDEI